MIGQGQPVQRPLTEKELVPGPAGTLEVVAEVPVGFDGRHGALVCHPHPLFGGTMDNKVVTTTARACRSLGYATVRFNFRGVGASTGEYDDGVGESQDALVVADWALAKWPGIRLTIAGFSFGAYVALRIANSRPFERLVAIAPPVGRFDFTTLAPPEIPWLVVQGDRDDLVDATKVREWAARFAPRATIALLEGAEHYFHGRLNDLKQIVQDYLGDGGI